MPVDMHVHTNASDGTDSPAEVVAWAKEIGLEAIAITDHDTVAGIEPAMEAGHIYGIEIVPGIELSAETNGEETHILGYMLDFKDKEFLKTISLFRGCRLKRVEQMVGRLRKMGLPVPMDRVIALSGSGSVGRPHLAAAMVEAGIVSDLAEAFDKFIGKGCPAYVPRYKIEPAEAVQLIRKANGLPVLAHPGLSNRNESILELVQKGLTGIEAYHPSHSGELSEYYRKLGEEYNLIITGGSDYHGTGRRDEQNLGTVTVSYAVLQEMKNRKGA